MPGIIDKFTLRLAALLAAIALAGCAGPSTAAPAAAAAAAEKHHEAVSEFTPAEALARLKNGNLRFVEGASKHPRADAERRAETVKNGQHPIATVVACSDSREPVEILFDQGIGDVFVIRVAGNVCSTNEIASIEYSSEHLATPVCLILGHTGCGAVTTAAADPKLEGCLGTLIDSIKPSVERAKKDHPELKDKALVAAAIEANVRKSAEDLLARSEGVSKLVAAGKLRVEGAIYDLETGKITWLELNGGKPAPARETKPASETKHH